MVVED
jgi:hypothetical protein